MMTIKRADAYSENGEEALRIYHPQNQKFGSRHISVDLVCVVREFDIVYYKNNSEFEHMK